jgi:hypothetical protein
MVVITQRLASGAIQIGSFTLLTFGCGNDSITANPVVAIRGVPGAGTTMQSTIIETHSAAGLTLQIGAIALLTLESNIITANIGHAGAGIEDARAGATKCAGRIAERGA